MARVRYTVSVEADVQDGPKHTECLALHLVKTMFILEKFGLDVSNFPLSYYRRKNIYTMFTDALDRFGTKLEKRFSKDEIYTMMDELGLESIKFSNIFKINLTMIA